jgi:hypothetical protein
MPTAAVAYWRALGGFLSFPLVTGFDIAFSIHAPSATGLFCVVQIGIGRLRVEKHRYRGRYRGR